MKITPLTYDQVPRSIYRRSFNLDFLPRQPRDLFFHVEADTSFMLKTHESEWDYVAAHTHPDLPLGVFAIKALDKEATYLMVICDPIKYSPVEISTYLQNFFTES